jgi:hypothetical protein
LGRKFVHGWLFIVSNLPGTRGTNGVHRSRRPKLAGT